MSDSSLGQEVFGQGGLNEQLDADQLLQEISLDRSKIAWRKDFIGFDSDDVSRLKQYQDVFADHAFEIADDFYETLRGVRRPTDQHRV